MRTSRADLACQAQAPRHHQTAKTTVQMCTTLSSNIPMVSLSPSSRTILLTPSLDFIHVLSLKGSLLYVSPAITRILGYTTQELIGRSIADLCHPADIVPVMRELKEASSTISAPPPTSSSNGKGAERRDSVPNASVGGPFTFGGAFQQGQQQGQQQYQPIYPAPPVPSPPYPFTNPLQPHRSLHASHQPTPPNLSLPANILSPLPPPRSPLPHSIATRQTYHLPPFPRAPQKRALHLVIEPREVTYRAWQGEEGGCNGGEEGEGCCSWGCYGEGGVGEGRR